MNRFRLITLLPLVTFAALTAFAADDPLPVTPAIEPDGAVSTIQLQDGFRAQLIAAEPLVTDPVDIAYDENGLAYVVEMNDYPYVDPSDDESWTVQNSAPIGRIRVLEDTDGDGVYDRSDIFAEGLSWPAGIACWKGGVYVAATPDLLYLKDTTGDRRADVRRVVFHGFRKYNVQAIMNNPRWGLDHRFHVAGSSNGGLITGQPEDAPGIALGRNDFAFDPTHEQLELLGGAGRFGNSFDDWGNRFLSDIRNPIQHVLFPGRYQRRNKHLAISSLLHDVAPFGDAVPVFRTSPPESWRVIHAERTSQSIHPERVDTAAATGYVTSSSGVTIYRGAAYPPEFHGNAFVGEVASNLVVRYVLEPDATSFTAIRPYQHVDFMTSTDNWFRPVNFANAPDGTLHVLDMYRQTIEHPWSLPEDLKKRLDLTAGRDRGRIYRLLPERYADGFVAPPRPQLGSASIEELVAHLENPNGWWRDTAHRLIFERQDPQAIAPLRDLVHSSDLAVARLHALWSLQGLNALETTDLLATLRDSDSRVQAHAVRLSEPYLVENAELQSTVAALAGSDDTKLRFQVAFSLGEAPSEAATQVLLEILLRDGQDAWMRAAVLSSLSGQELALLNHLLANADFLATEAGQSIACEVTGTVGARCTDAEIGQVLDSLAAATGASPAFENAIVISLGKGLKRQGKQLASVAGSGQSAGFAWLRQIIDRSIATAAASDHDPNQRAAATEMIEYIDPETAIAVLEPLVQPRVPAVVQDAAIARLGTVADPRIPGLLLGRYDSLSVSRQQLVVNQLMARSAWVPALFDAIESGQVPAARVPAVRQQVYMRSENEEFRARAVALFQSTGPTNFTQLIEEYQRLMPPAGDAQRGEAVYQKHCANCHKLGDQGFEVGPHLSTIKGRSDAELLVSILDPNREIAPNFLVYSAITVDGVVHTGVISSETDSTITLRGSDKNEIVLFRDDLEEFRVTNQSLMPVGLDKAITPTEMADLIALLRTQ